MKPDPTKYAKIMHFASILAIRCDTLFRHLKWQGEEDMGYLVTGQVLIDQDMSMTRICAILA